MARLDFQGQFQHLPWELRTMGTEEVSRAMAGLTHSVIYQVTAEQPPCSLCQAMYTELDIHRGKNGARICPSSAPFDKILTQGKSQHTFYIAHVWPAVLEPHVQLHDGSGSVNTSTHFHSLGIFYDLRFTHSPRFPTHLGSTLTTKQYSIRRFTQPFCASVSQSVK